MRHQLLLIRLLALVALAVSAAQFADSLTTAGAFCSFDGNCEAVTTSEYGRPLGVPLPVIGILGFGVIFALSLSSSARAFEVIRLLAAVAGVAGVALLAIQVAVLHRVCPLCMVVDSCAIGLAGIVLVKRPEPAALSRPRRVGLIAAAVAVLIVPFAWSLSALPLPPPPEVIKLWQEGTVNVVVVTDFDCPSCQRVDAVLKEVLQNHKVHLVRIPAPMTNHQYSRPAGRAYLAAARQGKGDEMASALYTAESRSPEHCREIAAKLGLDLAAYDRVVANHATDAELSDNVEWSSRRWSGLPLIWIQSQFFQGVPTVKALDSAIRHARPF